MNSLENKRKQDDELAKLSFERIELTDEDKKFISELKSKGKVSTVVTVDNQGHKVEISSDKYISEMEKKVMKLDNKMRLVDPYDVDETLKSKENQIANMSEILENRLGEKNARIENEAIAIKKHSMNLVNSMSSEDISEEEFDKMGYDLRDAVKAAFPESNEDADELLEKLKKYPLNDIKKILPAKFIETFLDTENDNPIEVKEQLISAARYIVVTGPDMDDLNEYVSYEHEKVNVLRELMQYNIDMMKVILTEESLAEIHRKCVENISAGAKMNYMRSVKNSSNIEIFFSEYAEVSTKLAEAYEKLLTDEKYASDEYAISCINAEITANRKKAEFYQNLPQLNDFSERMDIFIESQKSDKRGFKEESVHKLAKKAVEKVCAFKVDISFPGYSHEMRKVDEIYKAYLDTFCNRKSGWFINYNKIIDGLNEAGNNELSLKPVDEEYFEIIAEVILIVMTRMCKKYSKVNSEKFSGMRIESHFRLLCMLSSDIFVMNRICEIASKYVDEMKSHK